MGLFQGDHNFSDHKWPLKKPPNFIYFNYEGTLNLDQVDETITILFPFPHPPTQPSFVCSCWRHSPPYFFKILPFLDFFCQKLKRKIILGVFRRRRWSKFKVPSYLKYIKLGGFLWSLVVTKIMVTFWLSY